MKNDNEELLNLAEFKEKIRDVSKSNKENFIDSDIEIINFDEVKKAYCKKRTNIENTPKSNDGLYISEESMIFLEFKNANAKDIDMYDLSKKNYDSVCILSDIMGISIRGIREKTKYILIYSSEKNSKRAQRARRKKSARIFSPRRTEIDSGRARHRCRRQCDRLSKI